MDNYPPDMIPFTVDDLFGIQVGRVRYKYICKECGVELKGYPEPLNIHVEWHNKIADL